MGDFHHWDRDGEIKQEGAQEARNRILDVLFGDPKKDYLLSLRRILSDAKDRKAKPTGIRYITKRISECEKCEK